MRCRRDVFPIVLACAIAWVQASAASAQETTQPVPREETKPDQRPPAAKGTAGKMDGIDAKPALNEAWRKELQELERLTQADASDSGRKSGPSGWSMGFWLAFIVALAGGSIWAIVKYKRRISGVTDVNEMQIISRRAIDQRNSVVILRARGRDYLLGLGPSGVSLLTLLPAARRPELEPDSTIAEGSRPDVEKTPPATS